MPHYDYDDFEDMEESFAKRKDRRKPKGRRSVKELEQTKEKNEPRFEEPGLQHVFELGAMNELIGELKSGQGGDGLPRRRSTGASRC